MSVKAPAQDIFLPEVEDNMVSLPVPYTKLTPLAVQAHFNTVNGAVSSATPEVSRLCVVPTALSGKTSSGFPMHQHQLPEASALLCLIIGPALAR